MMYYVYIIKCSGNTLYTGITNDIDRRLDEHFGRTEKCAKFTRSHRAISLKALWSCENRSIASKLEYRIKRLTKEQKSALIADNSIFSQLFGEELSELFHREII